MVLFSDDFESGDFTAWTGTYGTPTIVNSPVHHGAFACELNGADDGVLKTIVANGAVNLRIYANFATLMSTNQVCYFMYMRQGASATVWAGCVRVAGVIYWQLYVNTSGGWETVHSVGTPVINNWYCVEVAFTKNTAGGCSLYVDGSVVASIVGTTLNTDVGYVRCWRGLEGGGVSFSVIIDCAVISTSYIGLESSYSPKTRCSLPNTMMQMLNGKMLYG
jgi:hypothetical protein